MANGLGMPRGIVVLPDGHVVEHAQASKGHVSDDGTIVVDTRCSPVQLVAPRPALAYLNLQGCNVDTVICLFENHSEVGSSDGYSTIETGYHDGIIAMINQLLPESTDNPMFLAECQAAFCAFARKAKAYTIELDYAGISFTQVIRRTEAEMACRAIVEHILNAAMVRQPQRVGIWSPCPIPGMGAALEDRRCTAHFLNTDDICERLVLDSSHGKAM